jgi:Mg2+-importing ATPase
VKVENNSRLQSKISKHSEHIFNISKLSNEALLEELLLTKVGEAKSRKKRIAKFGINMTARRKFNWFKVILEQCIQPFNLVMFCLIILDMVTYFVIKKGENETSDIISAAVSGVILLLTFTISLIEGYNSFKVDRQTNDIVANHFSILKKPIEDLNDIHFENLQSQLEIITYGKITIGDVILLKPGDIVPADMRIIWENNFAIDDNYIRGKMVRVKKEASYFPAEYIYDLKNIVISHSTVTDGVALAVVVAIGKHKISNAFSRQIEKESTVFYHRGLKKITFFVMLSTLIIFPISLVSVYFSAMEKGVEVFIESVMYSITIVVALIPESLPAVVAFNLQHGNKHILNEKVIIKNVEAVQDLGAVDIFVTNKTGSITKDRPLLVNWVDIYNEKNETVLNRAYLNAHFQSSIYYHFEQAILDLFDNKEELVSDFKVIRTKRILESQQKNGSVVIERDGIMYQIVVTSFEQIGESLEYYNDRGTIVEMNPGLITTIQKMGHDYVVAGYRPLVVASKIITDENLVNNDDMMFEGLLVFQDQLRDDIYDALRMFEKYNIDFKILSGDSLDIVKHAATQIGLKNINTITGEQLSEVPMSELNILIKNINVFAKLSSIQKSLIIHDYIKLNKVVAYVGDGVNDVLAIKKADVGITPNSSTPLAKKFADIIVVDKNLTNFDGAIKWGRITFLNTLKYIKLSIATNLGLFFALLISNICLPFFPLSSTQLLLQNLFIDFANIAFMMDSVSKESVKKSIKWKTKSIIHFVLINSLVPAILSFANLMIVAYGFGWATGGEIGYSDMMAHKVQTTMYIETFITRITSIFILRTDQILLWKDRPRWKFTVVMLSVLFMLIMIPYIPECNTMLEMVPPDPIWWSVMLGIFAATILFESLVKVGYKKIFKMWF